MYYAFWIPEGDELIAWLAQFPDRQRSKVIRAALNEHMRRGGGLEAPPPDLGLREAIAEDMRGLLASLGSVALQPCPPPQAEGVEAGRVDDETLKKRAERMKRTAWAG